MQLFICFSLAYRRFFGNKVEKKWFWFLAIYLVLLAGLRNNVGPDYGSYKMIYLYSGSKEYINIFLKALHLEGSENVDLEWLYALINKVLLNVFNAPYYVLTLVIAIFAIFFKVEYTDDNTFYPFTFTLFMFIPNFFIVRVDSQAKLRDFHRLFCITFY